MGHRWRGLRAGSLGADLNVGIVIQRWHQRLREGTRPWSREEASAEEVVVHKVREMRRKEQGETEMGTQGGGQRPEQDRVSGGRGRGEKLSRAAQRPRKRRREGDKRSDRGGPWVVLPGTLGLRRESSK